MVGVVSLRAASARASKGLGGVDLERERGCPDQLGLPGQTRGKLFAVRALVRAVDPGPEQARRVVEVPPLEAGEPGGDGATAARAPVVRRVRERRELVGQRAHGLPGREVERRAAPAGEVARDARAVGQLRGEVAHGDVRDARGDAQPPGDLLADDAPRRARRHDHSRGRERVGVEGPQASGQLVEQRGPAVRAHHLESHSRSPPSRVGVTLSAPSDNSARWERPLVSTRSRRSARGTGSTSGRIGRFGFCRWGPAQWRA